MLIDNFIVQRILYIPSVVGDEPTSYMNDSDGRVQSLTRAMTGRGYNDTFVAKRRNRRGTRRR